MNYYRMELHSKASITGYLIHALGLQTIVNAVACGHFSAQTSEFQMVSLSWKPQH